MYILKIYGLENEAVSFLFAQFLIYLFLPRSICRIIWSSLQGINEIDVWKYVSF